MKSFALAALASTALLSAAASAQDVSSLPAGEYNIDKTHGYVFFSYSHLGFSNPILRFDDVDATVTLNPEDPASSTLSVNIDPASVNTGVEKFDGHLKSGDFFEVETHPEITFVSTGIDLATDTTGTLTGDLTIKGITKPVTLDVTLNGAGKHPISGTETIGISATGTVDRTEWDLGAYAPAVSAEVDLRIEAEFLKAE